MIITRVEPIFCEKSEYADLEYLPEQIYEAINMYLESVSRTSSLDMQDITEGEFEIRINWKRNER